MNLPSGDDNSLVVKSSAALQPSTGGTALQSNHNDLRLKVLVLDEEIPFPLNSGKRIRTWNLLRNLCRQHSITFLCYGTTTNPGLPQLESLGIRVILVPPLPPSDSSRFYAGALANLVSQWPYSVSRYHTRNFTVAIRKLIAKEPFDLVHCEWTPYASYHSNGPARWFG